MVGLGVKLTVGAAVVGAEVVVAGAAVVGQALHTGQLLRTSLAGEALLSPDRLASTVPHGHGGQVAGALVVGFGVKLTVGATVVGAAVVVGVDGAHGVWHSAPLNPALHLHTSPWQTPFPEHTTFWVRAGEALLSPLKLALEQLWLTDLAGEALLSPLKLASQDSSAASE